MLTHGQEKFVQELVKGKTQREAYRIAYPNNKSNDKSIDEKASHMFAVDKIKARYFELRSKMVKEAENECVVDVLKIVKELSKIGFSDMKDFVEFGTKNGKPYIKVKDSSEIDGTAIQSVSVNKAGHLTIKLHDKLTALDRLAKYIGMYTDKLEITGSIKNPFEGMSTEKLEKILEGYNDRKSD